MKKQTKILAKILGLGALLILFGCATPSGKSFSRQEKAMALVAIARGALVEGDPTGALIQLAEAEKLDDSIADIYHTRALAFLAKQDRGAALENTEQALKLAPEDSGVLTTLGYLFLEEGNYKKAEPALLKAASDPLYREAYRARTSLGILYYRQGDLLKSRGALDRAIQSEPNLSCIAFYYRGHINLKNSRLPEAIRDYESATSKYCAGFVDAHFALGVAYTHAQRYGLARQKFLEIQQRFPKSNFADQAVDRMRQLP